MYSRSSGSGESSAWASRVACREGQGYNLRLDKGLGFRVQGLGLRVFLRGCSVSAVMIAWTWRAGRLTLPMCMSIETMYLAYLALGQTWQALR